MDNSETFKTNGKQPKTLHVAHRRSPSELTTLMQEQLNLQRQLEIVQQQQQNLLQQQQQLNQKVQSQSSKLGPNDGFVYQKSHHHRKSSSNFDYNNSNYQNKSHRRSQSSVSSINGGQGFGHNRRHSLGLAEAKKAAAEVQAQRNGYSPSKLSMTQRVVLPEESNLMPPPTFKFPPEGPSSNHERSNSNVSLEKSPQRGFQFPSQKDSNIDMLAPPQPSFAERRNYNHQPQKSTGSDYPSWRKAQDLSPPDQNVFVPGHRSKGSMGGGSVSSISQFNSQGRKSLFAPYLPQSSIPELIADGRLVIGTLRVNKKNRSDAYVSTDGLLDADIFICGSKDRNRALEGDVVAVELLVVDDVWSSKREKEEKKRRKDSKFNIDLSDDLHNDATSVDVKRNLSSDLNRKGSLKQRPTQKKNDDVEVEGQSLLLAEEEEINDDIKPLYAGHVVAVIDRIPGQLFAGTLGLYRPSQANKRDDNNNNEEKPKPKIVWFKPIDKKVPLIAIPTEQAPKDFIENNEKYLNQTFIASIKRWPITSLHPFGTLISRLGDQDDQNVEVESILRDNNFLCDEFQDLNENDFMIGLPSSNDILKLSNGKNRKDFSNDYIIACTPNGTFCDHSFHVKSLDNGKIELGVHVIDISEFILNDSNVDKRAKKRSHGVYLPQKIVNLFPDVINNEISFNKDKKSPAISIVFEIDLENFEIENVWMDESVIQPSAKISYDEIDSILLNNQNLEDTAVSGYIETLSHIASQLKQKRFSNPKLDYSSVLPLLDQLDDENVKLSLDIYDKINSTSMIDEIFRNVNAAVAQKTHSALGDLAILRKFSMPTLTKFEYHEKKIEQLGVKLDTTSPKSFQNSILNIEDPIKREIIETILLKCMSRGKYIVAGNSDQDSLGHYLFNFPVYTHFTSPLKRYSDVIVHRQLKHVINNLKYNEDIDSLKIITDYCNFKKDCAKSAQYQAIHLLLCQTINDMSLSSGQILCYGVIIQVYESSFDVYLPDFGIEKRVHGDQLPLNKAEFNKLSSTLELYWKPGVDSATFVPKDETEPLSYRNSIKNKHRGTTTETSNDDAKLSEELSSKLSALNLKSPNIDQLKLNDYLEFCSTRTEKDQYIQEIKLLGKIPILLRSEIGMALPCLTVKAVNPFVKNSH